VRLSALRASVRTLEGVLALTPLAGERVDSSLPSSPFGRTRFARTSNRLRRLVDTQPLSDVFVAAALQAPRERHSTDRDT
jgi:hypothetical protein